MKASNEEPKKKYGMGQTEQSCCRALSMANASTNLLAVDVKKTEKVALTQVLRDYISNAYAEHPDLYTDDFRVLDELRMDCIHLGAQHNALNRLIK